jgi:hypothetical protein
MTAYTLDVVFDILQTAFLRAAPGVQATAAQRASDASSLVRLLQLFDTQAATSGSKLRVALPSSNAQLAVNCVDATFAGVSSATANGGICGGADVLILITKNNSGDGFDKAYWALIVACIILSR